MNKIIFEKELRMDIIDFLAKGSVVREKVDEMEKSQENEILSDREIFIYYKCIRNKKIKLLAIGSASEIDDIESQIDEDFQKMNYTEYRILSMRFYQKVHEEELWKSNSDEGFYENESLAERRLRRYIKRWIAKTSYADFYDEISWSVKGQPELDKVLANTYAYMNCIANRVKPNCNMIIAAPSGCGKTETYRALKKYFENHLDGFVITQTDMTSITTEGFKGKDTNDVVKELLEKPKENGIGIVFMDEFDKKLTPCHSGSGDNVNADIQAQILTLVEGRKVYCKDAKIDTSNTLFIGLGAFDRCRKNRIEKSIGFGENPENKKDHYSKITREDMLKMGASAELIGRFAQVINYVKVDKKIVYEITEKIAKELSEQYMVSILLEDEYKEYISGFANEKFGFRFLKSKIQEELLGAYIEILRSGKAIKDCVIHMIDENQVEVENPQEDEKAVG